MTLDVLQDRIGYRFKDESLLVLAVTHSSWANEHSAATRTMSVWNSSATPCWRSPFQPSCSPVSPMPGKAS